jgi:hypothetical protein
MAFPISQLLLYFSLHLMFAPIFVLSFSPCLHFRFFSKFHSSFLKFYYCFMCTSVFFLCFYFVFALWIFYASSFAYNSKFHLSSSNNVV